MLAKNLGFKLPPLGQEATYTFYSEVQDRFITVTVDDVPYCIAIKPHPTCANYETYDVEFEVRPANILELDLGAGEWIYPFICDELNAYLNFRLARNPQLKEQLIKEELELCLA